MSAPCAMDDFRQQEPEERGEDKSGEEAIAAYREWRARVIGDHDTRVHDILDLLAEMREEPGC